MTVQQSLGVSDRLDFAQIAPNSALFDLPALPESVLDRLSELPDLHRLNGVVSKSVADGVTVYPLHPETAGLAWTLQLFDISQTLSRQCHERHSMVLWVIEGKMTVRVDGIERTLLPGHSLRLFQGSGYSLIPGEKGCRFLTLQIPRTVPAFTTLDEAGALVEGVRLQTEDQLLLNQLALLEKQHYEEKFENGANTAYDIISGRTTGGRFNISILDVVDSSRHFHRLETGRVLVLGGELKAELNGREHLVQIGQMVRISPGAAHRLQSTQTTPVRLLCLNLPAFDPSDVHPIS